MLSNTLRLNFDYLKIIHIYNLRYHPKITVEHIFKNTHKSKCVCVHDMQLIIMKNKDEDEK